MMESTNKLLLRICSSIMNTNEGGPASEARSFEPSTVSDRMPDPYASSDSVLIPFSLLSLFDENESLWYYWHATVLCTCTLQGTGQAIAECSLENTVNRPASVLISMRTVGWCVKSEKF